jgi:hypothetical protein
MIPQPSIARHGIASRIGAGGDGRASQSDREINQLLELAF